jgi:ubiquinone/menaquinone biosynthesis C-methylase UbiE
MESKELDWTGERLVTGVRGIGVTEHLHRYAIACEYVRDKVVLDIASGEGYGSNLLAKNARRVIGVDVSQEAITFSSEKYKKTNLSFKTGSVTNIPLKDFSVDIVVSFETLEHVSDQELMFREIKRVLKPDGLVIISTPEKSNYEDFNKEKNHFHVKELYFKEFEQLINNHFRNFCFLFQKSVYGTLIIPRTKPISGFAEFTGSFTQIYSTDTINRPVFNICLASDDRIPVLIASFFDAQEYFDQYLTESQNQIKILLDSNTYRAGKILLTPLRKVKNWIFK